MLHPTPDLMANLEASLAEVKRKPCPDHGKVLCHCGWCGYCGRKPKGQDAASDR